MKIPSPRVFPLCLLAAFAGCRESPKPAVGPEQGPPAVEVHQPSTASDKTGAAIVTDKAADLKWAREVAESYLHDAGSDDSSRANAGQAWTTTAFQERLKGVWGKRYLFTSWRIASESMAPDAQEVIFKGVLTARGRVSYSDAGNASVHTMSETPITFRLLVVKEAGSGRWRVDSMTCTAPEEEKK
jgi:hypothetical protein